MDTGIFANDPVRILLGQNPWLVYLIGLVFIPGPIIMSAMRWYDIKYGNGIQEGIDGYLAWWVIILFDIVGGPIFVGLAAVFAQKTAGFESTTAAHWGWCLLAGAFAVGSVTFFILTAHHADWTKTAGASIRSLNMYGRYHALMFFTLAYLMASVIIRGSVLVITQWIEIPTETLVVFFGLVIVVLSTFVYPTIGPDVGIRQGEMPRPGELIGTDF
ncbi:hypothetical protein KC573_01595 [candidate division WWE3 bacterium]|uniref:Uncharacterized protein n=1 Tax=candidate division WWE3 bacterium TaxID=2053526 RepID=A0A955RWW4_UNCKA|nr:hypothetical protein [candidate division WWE3 bacterium]